MKCIRFTLTVVLALVAFALSAQTVVRGTITSAEDGEPLIGVTILVEGTTTGTVTDIDGKFELTAKPTDVLLFSYTGRESMRIPIEGKSNLSVAMQGSGVLIEELVVTGYGETNRQAFTGSAVRVDPLKIEKAPRASAQESLQGNVPGLFLTQGSGQPGANQQIVIRGIGSITAGTQPLYVIDGIPVVAGDISRLNTTSNTIAGINPNDIESITVLKDASATSIYGSRGANGVIVITTKGGKTGKPRITANFQTGLTQMNQTPDTKPLNMAEYLELLSEGLINAGNVNFNGKPIATQEEALAYLGGRFNTGNDSTDWFKEIIRDGIYSQANVSIGGGSDATKYYISGGYYKEEGVLLGSDFDRLSGKMSLDNKVTNWLNLGVDLTLSRQNINTLGEAGAFANPVRSLYRLAPYTKPYNADGTYDLSYNQTFNPVALARENKRLTVLNNLIGSINATVKLPVKGLTFVPRFSSNQVSTDESQYRNPFFGDGRNVGGQGYEYFTQYRDWVSTNLLKYSTLLAQSHGLEIILGQEAQRRSFKSVSTSASNFTPGLTSLAGAAKVETATASISEATINSLFANASYNYKGIYYLNGTIRRDGSSRFGLNNRFGNFWSVGASVNLHRLPFLENNATVTELKLRGSYGLNGNQEIGFFASRGLYSIGNDYDDSPGYVFSQIANDDLTWEINKPANIGIDLTLFNRITLIADIYKRTTSSLLLDVPISATNGVTAVTRNEGEMENKGLELTLATQNVKAKRNNGFTWNTDFNISFNKNTVNSLPNGAFVSGIFRRDVGLDFNSVYTFGYAGVDPDRGVALWYVDSTKTETTDVYTSAKRFYQGNVSPKFFGGLTNTLGYAGLTLSFQINFVWGNQVYDTWAAFTHSDGNRQDTDTGNMARYLYDNRWRQPGDVTDVPKVIWGNRTQSNQASTRFLYDGSFARLRDVTLSYDLPKSLLSKASINGISVFLRGNNLYTYIKDDRIWQDPQTDTNGQWNQEAPIAKTFVFGVEVKL